MARCRSGTCRPPIGRPISETETYLLDQGAQPVPPGVAGELAIGGAGVARGYLGQPRLTAAKFIPNSFGQAGGRLYRTGDLVRLLPEGLLGFIGRTDHQVKVRGHRIELGEIESVLAGHEAVRDVVVVTRGDESGGRQLVAYFVVQTGVRTAVAELRRYLIRKLPRSMIPAIFHRLKALPLTPSGKVDRRALPVPNQHERGALAAPRDALELELVEIWEELLGRRPISIDDNFFELGGHSLLAVRLAARLRERLGRNLPLAVLFRESTVESLAAALRKGWVPSNGSPLIKLRREGGERPFFCVHPIGGNPLCYRDLARLSAGAQPFYGLQARGIDSQEEPIDNVEAMAAHYLAAVAEVQPEGPFALGGWSMGAAVAFEMARQLSARGAEIASLALLDPSPIGGGAGEASGSALLAHWVRDLGRQAGVDTDLSSDELRGLDATGQQHRALFKLRRSGLVPAELEPGQLEKLFEVMRSNLRALKDYRPRLYSGQLTVFVPRDGLSPRRWTELRRWAAFATGGAEWIEVPGDHYSMIRGPHVEALADRLTWSLRRADRRPVLRER